MNYLIDTHAHLNDLKFADDIPETIARAQAAGVVRIVVCGCDIETSRAAVELSERFECVYATVGVHPHDAKSFNDDTICVLMELSAGHKVIAIGEIGLDFHYDFSPRPEQFAAFRSQIDLAGALGLPIVVHSRESNFEALEILREKAELIHNCVFHCFSGDVDFAREVLDLGFYIGVDGPVTYKASEKLRKVIAMCPNDKLVLETDCPYLTPVPFRGKRNEPAYLNYIAQQIASIKGISLEEVAKMTTANAYALFAPMD